MPVAESEVRCERCANRHPTRKPPLLATVRGTEVLAPVRLEQRDARRLGIPRGGLFWRRPPLNPDGEWVLRCRRCGQVRLFRVPVARV